MGAWDAAARTAPAGACPEAKEQASRFKPCTLGNILCGGSNAAHAFHRGEQPCTPRHRCHTPMHCTENETPRILHTAAPRQCTPIVSSALGACMDSGSTQHSRRAQGLILMTSGGSTPAGRNAKNGGLLGATRLQQTTAATRRRQRSREDGRLRCKCMASNLTQRSALPQHSMTTAQRSSSHLCSGT